MFVFIIISINVMLFYMMTADKMKQNILQHDQTKHFIVPVHNYIHLS